jgi:hypothetical protein
VLLVLYQGFTGLFSLFVLRVSLPAYGRKGQKGQQGQQGRKVRGRTGGARPHWRCEAALAVLARNGGRDRTNWYITLFRDSPPPLRPSAVFCGFILPFCASCASLWLILRRPDSAKGEWR